MLEQILSSPQITALEQALNAASIRHKVISNNIANVNTPGFKKSAVEFESLLAAALDGPKLKMTRTNPRHFGAPDNIAAVRPRVEDITDTSMRTDQNNVDIDVEMAELAKNNIYYDAAARQIGGYFNGLRAVIEGR